MTIRKDYRDLRRRGRSRRSALRWLYHRYVMGGLPVRVMLVWYAIRGRAIVYRATFENGTLKVDSPAYMACCTINGDWGVEGGNIVLGTPINIAPPATIVVRKPAP